MKKILLIIVIVSLLVSNDIYSQRKSSLFKSSYKIKSSYNYTTPKLKSYSNSYLKSPKTTKSNFEYKTTKPKSSSNNYFKSTTYRIGKTKYKYGETYKSSGLPKVYRSSSSKKEFLNSRGYTKAPKGYEVDHIQPLSKGGRMCLQICSYYLKKFTNRKLRMNERNSS